MPAVVDLLRTIAMLFVVLAAPKRMMARVRVLDRVGLVGFAHALEWMHKRDIPLRRPGESLATAVARVDLVIWIARDPVAALRWRVRQMRGWKRARYGAVAPLSFAPPRLACAALCAGIAGFVPAPET